MLQQAIAHHRGGRLAVAAQLYRSLLISDPGHRDANFNLGLIDVHSGRPLIGLAHLKAAVDADPLEPRYWS